ncbi:DUF2141 domain-containing protein [Parapusillimonas sp. SGNA-6]|nr:DUF2141 domain-containing protein [Parapusillimonas sp. SGNA-6]
MAIGTAGKVLMAGCAMALLACSAAAADLTLRVAGLKNAEGKVAIAVFAGPDGFPRDDGKAVRRVRLPIDASSRSALTVMRDLPAGDYAVAVYHDDNESGRLETNIFGLPQKGYGFSRNVRPKMRAPSFDKARFSLPEQGAELDIAVGY